MPCATIATGERFLSGVLDHIDCQASTLGWSGFQALARPDGLAQVVLAAVLTLTIAMLAIRIIGGRVPWGAELITLTTRVGIALTLALSWPAFHVLVYDTVLHGPAEVVQALQPGETTGALTTRLQGADNAIVLLTERGTGRETYAAIADGRPGFKGVGLDDRPTFGWARVAFLVGVLGPLVAIRLVAGLLLALMPLVAGLLLLPQTRSVFAGWIKALCLCFTASVGLAVLYSVELALLEPWLSSAFQALGSGYATPSAPTELLVLTLSFATASMLLIGIFSRVAFYQVGPELVPLLEAIRSRGGREDPNRPAALPSRLRDHPLALAVPERVTGVGPGAPSGERVPVIAERKGANPASPDGAPPAAPPIPLGSSNRRSSTRRSAASQRRDSHASGSTR